MSIVSKFLVTGIFSFVMVSIISIAWPKFTGLPRPEPLVRIHEIVRDTTMGKQTAMVLGVHDEKNIEPIDAKILVGQLQGWAGDAIKERATQIVTKQAVNQIGKGFESLSDREKAVLREAICKPASESATP
jgi:hypothetical protein